MLTPVESISEPMIASKPSLRSANRTKSATRTTSPRRKAARPAPASKKAPAGLKFAPQFHKQAGSPFDHVEWDKRTAEINDDAGKVIFNAPQQDSKVLRVVFRVGYALANPVTAVNQVVGTRSPFTVLTPADGGS